MFFGPTHCSLLLLDVLWHDFILLASFNIIAINLHFEFPQCFCKLLDCSQCLLVLTGGVWCPSGLLVLCNIIDNYMHFELPYCLCKLLGCCQCCFAFPLFAGGLCYRSMTSLFHTHHLGKPLTIWCFHDKLCVPIDCCHLYRKVLLHWIAYASYVIFVPVHIVWCDLIVSVSAFAYPRFEHSLHYLMLLLTPPQRFIILYNASVHLNFVRCSRLSLFCMNINVSLDCLRSLRSSLMLFGASWLCFTQLEAFTINSICWIPWWISNLCGSLNQLTPPSAARRNLWV